MHRLLKIGFLIAAAALGAASAASAQQVMVERSGHTFHTRVCAGPDIAGYARCHSHVVTDYRGNIIVHNVTRNITPSGYGPADLRSAYAVSGSGSSATTVAIVDAYGYNNAEADLNVYRSQYGLGACNPANGCFKKVNPSGQQGNYPPTNRGRGPPGRFGGRDPPGRPPPCARRTAGRFASWACYAACCIRCRRRTTPFRSSRARRPSG